MDFYWSSYVFPLSQEPSVGEEVMQMSTDEIVSRSRLLDNEVKIMKSEVMRISHELQAQNDKIKENTEKIKVNKTLPYLVSNVIEVKILSTLLIIQDHWINLLLRSC